MLLLALLMRVSVLSKRPTLSCHLFACSLTHVDSESEATVQEALDELMKNTMMTTLVIAHRLSTVRNADMIAVVDNGKVVESGTHDELLAMKSHYFRLVEAQKRKPSETVDSTPSSSEHDSQREVDLSAPDNHTTTNNAVIEFEDVHFEYPTRPDAPVFRGLNLKVRQGETLALVGPSGCGKSTVIQLMECFYRPTLGTVKYHGVDMKDLNVRWLRDQLGLVSQQPVLFDCSIEENIRYSLPDASREQVVEAAKQANAHDFIMEFPEQYQTSVGQGSTLVSGGKRACSKIPGGSAISISLHFSCGVLTHSRCFSPHSTYHYAQARNSGSALPEP